MDRLKEIESRKNEIKTSLESITDLEELRKLNDEVDSLNSEAEEIRAQEERNKLANEVETKKVELKEIEIKKEENKMEEKKYGLDSKEYRSAYLKKLMGKGNELTVEERTAESTVSTDVAGAIPTQTLNTIFEQLTKKVPMLDEVTLLRVRGSVEFSVETARTDGQDHEENTTVDSEAIKLTTVSLSGKEIVKVVHISGTVKTMTIDAFEDWLTNMLSDSLANSIEAKLINNMESGTKYAGVITADVIRSGVGQLASMYEKNAKFRCPRSLFYETILGLQDKAKNDLVIYENGQYRILGYPVQISDKATYLTFGDAKRVVANLAQDVTINHQYDVDSNKHKYNGVAIFDSVLSDENASIVFTNAAASE